MKHVSVREISIKVGEPKSDYNVAITNPEIVASIVRKMLDGRDQESFYVFLLNSSHHIYGVMEVHRGTADTCPVYPRDVFRAAIIDSATAILVAHNHPSGSLEPSQHDIQLTEKLKMCADIVGIPILDHVIVTNNDRFSFAENFLPV